MSTSKPGCYYIVLTVLVDANSWARPLYLTVIFNSGTYVEQYCESKGRHLEP